MSAAPAAPWLRSPSFDLGLIAGVLTLALVLGGVALAHPALFVVVLYADFWLLAYPHVASMYTRVAFDRASVRSHWLLLFVLPPLVLAATAGVVGLGGVVALNTLYFYWQSWHYTRQSYGIARAYERSTGAPTAARTDVPSLCVVYGFPAWGLLHRAHQHHAEFFGSPLWSPGVPRWLAVGAGAFAIASLAVWTWRRLRPAAGEAPLLTGHTLFVLSHVVMTVVSYVLVRDVTRGWLFINIWHNAQYLLFVWAFNARQFKGGVDPSRPLISRLSQRRNVAWYAGVCLGLSTVFYFALGQITARSTWQVLPVVLIAHQAVNFHHYIVDAVIWRSRKNRKTLAAPVKPLSSSPRALPTGP